MRLGPCVLRSWRVARNIFQADQCHPVSMVGARQRTVSQRQKRGRTPLPVPNGRARLERSTDPDLGWSLNMRMSCERAVADRPLAAFRSKDGLPYCRDLSRLPMRLSVSLIHWQRHGFVRTPISRARRMSKECDRHAKWL